MGILPIPRTHAVGVIGILPIPRTHAVGVIGILPKLFTKLVEKSRKQPYFRTFFLILQNLSTSR